MGTLDRARSDLQALALTAETEIGRVAGAFEDLAGHTGAMLDLAAELVGCVESDSMGAVLNEVQSLGAAARLFIQERLQATAGILETVTGEVALLRHLAHLTQGQKSVARESNSLSVLTSIEVARLGSVGSGFQYLAHELAEFSRSVTEDARVLATEADDRRQQVEEARRALGREIPRMHAEFARIEAGLGAALAVADSSFAELSRIPVQFRQCVQEIAGQIAGVVAAIQAQDITRQQIEHVQEGLTLISASFEDSAPEAAAAHACAGLNIQIYQLRAIKQTVAGWASQIQTCMGGIMRISSSELVAIGPVVLGQERELSSQLARIERLEQECLSYNESVQHALGGLSSLMELVREHLDRSKAVRDRLQLLMFNSIVEASHLGGDADAILAISQSIKRVAEEWSGITDQSAQAMQQMMEMVESTGRVMHAFSDASNDGLRTAQEQTRAGLEDLRGNVETAGRQALKMNDATARLQSRIAQAGDVGQLFDGCLSRVDAVLGSLEGLHRESGADLPRTRGRIDAAEVERIFSSSYTTEMEREVLRAALRGGPLPSLQQQLGGNDVELF